MNRLQALADLGEPGLRDVDDKLRQLRDRDADTDWDGDEPDDDPRSRGSSFAKREARLLREIELLKTQLRAVRRLRHGSIVAGYAVEMVPENPWDGLE